MCSSVALVTFVLIATTDFDWLVLAPGLQRSHEDSRWLSRINLRKNDEIKARERDRVESPDFDDF
jgi:hypothetical protein